MQNQILNRTKQLTKCRLKVPPQIGTPKFIWPICPIGQNILNTGIPQFTLLMWRHTKKAERKKVWKLRLLSSTQKEERRIENYKPGVNLKSRKSKQRKSRNACMLKKAFIRRPWSVISLLGRETIYGDN